MEDMLSISDEMRARKRRRILYVVLVIYFTALFIYAINIAQRQMPFFTSVVGFDSYQEGGLATMRVFVIGMKENAPLRGFSAKLELSKPSTGKSWMLYEGNSGRETFIEIMSPLTDIPKGEYSAILTTSHPEYGEEVNEFTLTITPNRAPRAVDIQQLDEKYTKRSKPLLTKGLSPDLQIRLIANNGRYMPSLNNKILVVAERADTQLPVEGIKIEISVRNKPVAQVITDAMGLATFDFYPSALGDDQMLLKVSDLKGNVFSASTFLAPIGSQVVLTPRRQMIATGEKLSMKIEALRPGVWYIDVFQYGNWLLSSHQDIGSAASYIELDLPRGLTGPIYVQAASNFMNPTTSFDAFYAFVYDSKMAELDQEDPRIKNAADPEDPKLDDIRLEAPFKKLWQFVNGNVQFPQDIVDRWLRKINALSLQQKPYEPRKLAKQILSEVPKDYLLLPEVFNSQSARTKTFADKQKQDRDNVLILLGLSGILVIFFVVLAIIKEVQSRPEDAEIEMGGKNIAMLAMLLAITVAGYGMILYLLSILDWHKGI